MKHLKHFFCAGAGWLLAAGLTASGTPIQRSDVAADASWVLHVDVDRLRPTAAGQYFQSQLAQPEPAAKLAAFQAIFGFDPRTQLHGVTLYGWQTKGVLLVDADFDAERLTTLAKAAKKYESTTYHNHVIGSWIDENKKKKDGEAQRTYGVIVGKRVLFGQQESTVEQALDVLDGNSSTLAGSSTFPQLGASEDASIIEGAAREFPLTEPGPQAVILKMSRLISLQIGESQQQVNATLNLVAKDATAANQIAAIAQGLLALVKLQQQNPAAGKIAQALQIHQDGAAITASLTLPADAVVEALKADAARTAAKKQEHEDAEDAK